VPSGTVAGLGVTAEEEVIVTMVDPRAGEAPVVTRGMDSEEAGEMAIMAADLRAGSRWW
jgi:hypothetical protein